MTTNTTTNSGSDLRSLHTLQHTLERHLGELMAIEHDNGDTVDTIQFAIAQAEKALARARQTIHRTVHGSRLQIGDRVKGVGPHVPQHTCGAPFGTVLAISTEHGTVKVQWDGHPWSWHSTEHLKRV